MWDKLKQFFHGSPSKLKVAKLIVETGLRLGDNGKIYCGEIEISATKIAVAAGVDRRVVKETAEAISKADGLREIFTNIRPGGPLLRDGSRHLNYGVVEIKAKPQAPSIIAETFALISKKGISIRQILADGPDFYPNPN